ncbi:MAG TPA: hypothetical protein VM434_20330 [Beijerinckiaceae bacterium]|nr:hypothetical protein [Beijerinckiaceae bacterium]
MSTKIVDGIEVPLSETDIAQAAADAAAPMPPAQRVGAPRPVLAVSAHLEIDALGGINAVATTMGVAFVMEADEGVYWAFFEEEFANANYVVMQPNCRKAGSILDARVTEQDTYYFEITVTRRDNGEPARPDSISFAIIA